MHKPTGDATRELKNFKDTQKSEGEWKQVRNGCKHAEGYNQTFQSHNTHNNVCNVLRSEEMDDKHDESSVACNNRIKSCEAEDTEPDKWFDVD